MPAPRISSDEQIALAIDDLAVVGSHLADLDVVPTGRDRVDLHPRSAGDRGLSAKVIASEAVGIGDVERLAGTEARGRKVVVADRISDEARQRLTALGWSWLDRKAQRAHFRLPGRDFDLVALPDALPAVGDDRAKRHLRAKPLASEGPIRGRAGIAYAAALLCSPDAPPSFRSVAASVGMSPTAISNAVARLAEAGLVGQDKEPVLPDLFWTLAEVWGPITAAPIALPPDPDDPMLQPNVGQLDQPGWVLGGDLAAAELGAPLFSTEHRPWVWVPTQVELRRAERRYGKASWEDRAAVLAVPATPLVCQLRRPGGAPGWPLPHPVFAALDLARDRGRGREILEQWDPEEARAVWR